MWNKIKAIIGIIFIAAIIMTPIDKSSGSFYSQSFANLWEPIKAHLAECVGINQSISEKGTIATYLDRVQETKQQQQHYASSNGVGEGTSTKAILLPFIVIFLFLGIKGELNRAAG